MGEKMTLRDVLDGVLVHVDGIAPYAEVPVVDLQAWADTLTAHLTQPAQAVDDGEVLIAIERGEGYEDVHPELVAEDAMQSAVERGWRYRVITTALHKDSNGAEGV